MVGRSPWHATWFWDVMQTDALDVFCGLQRAWCEFTGGSRLHTDRGVHPVGSSGHPASPGCYFTSALAWKVWLRAGPWEDQLETWVICNAVIEQGLMESNHHCGERPFYCASHAVLHKSQLFTLLFSTSLEPMWPSVEVIKKSPPLEGSECSVKINSKSNV